MNTSQSCEATPRRPVYKLGHPQTLQQMIVAHVIENQQPVVIVMAAARKQSAIASRPGRDEVKPHQHTGQNGLLSGVSLFPSSLEDRHHRRHESEETQISGLGCCKSAPELQQTRHDVAMVVLFAQGYEGTRVRRYGGTCQERRAVKTPNVRLRFWGVGQGFPSGWLKTPRAGIEVGRLFVA